MEKANRDQPKKGRKRNKTEKRQVARDSFTAWRILCEAGGIELDGRDAGFEESLRRELLDSAPTLEDALRSTSTDELVIAFFGVAASYVEMFRAILDFYQAAGAAEGRDNLELQVQNEHFSLQHFQKFLETWESVDSEFDVPSIDSDGAWAVLEAGGKIPSLGSLFDYWDKESALSTGLGDVDNWLVAYRRGLYLPFPTSLHPNNVAPELADAAAIAAGTVDTIRRHWPDRVRMNEEHRRQKYEIDRSDGFSPRTIAQHETDFRLASTVVILALYQTLSALDQQTFASHLTALLGRYPRRKLGIRADLPLLERILSLPLWKHRHELYAVWIATEIVSALGDHDCELHHDNGRITFSFRETLVATVHTAQPKVRLYSERRSPLDRPIGHGRSQNVQPDYSLWRAANGGENCGLVIEVKHYKADAAGRFREVMVDYARAHPKAKVVLVSHGPATESFHDVDADVCHRCMAKGGLTVRHLESRTELRTLVRDYVGAPILSATRGKVVPRKAAILAIDVSMSMEMALRSPDFIAMLTAFRQGAAEEVALIDSCIRQVCPFHALATTIQATPCGATVSLADAMRDLTSRYPAVVLATDSDGRQSLLAEFSVRHIATQWSGTVRVEIIEVSKPATTEPSGKVTDRKSQ